MNNKQKLWSELSYLFNDSEVFYHELAEEIYNLGSIDEIHHELFEVVSPVCYYNFMTPIPTVWSGFKEEVLFKDIATYQNSLQNSLWQRIKHRFIVQFCKLLIASSWIELEKEILKLQKQE